MSNQWSSPKEFERFLITEYFKHGSINKVFYFHHFNLPISYAGFDRILTKHGVVKSAGPNSKLTESLRLLRLVADYKLSLEKIYEKYAPHKLLVSTNTLHRVLHYTRLGLTRRQGVALIITPKENPNLFLTGYDQSIINRKLGNKGDLSLPMGHSKTSELPQNSITRVLQQEVFTDLVLQGKFPKGLVPQHLNPIMFINIADIKVAVYHLQLRKNFSFSSFKLHHLQFRDLTQIYHGNPRPGVLEIVERFTNPNPAIKTNQIPEYQCNLNYALSDKI